MEESAAAADSLQQQAATLAQVVSVFRLSAGSEGATAIGSYAPPPAPRMAPHALAAPKALTHRRA